MYDTIWYDVTALQSLAMECESFLIIGHTHPDGDCVGAALALGTALKDLDKQVYVCLEEYSDRYDIIPGSELICRDTDIVADVAIAVDCSTIDRLGIYQDIFKKAKFTMNIDHHIGNTNFAMQNYVYEAASSTCEIVYNMINNWVLIDKPIATAIYAGIVFDTGGFRHACTTPSVHRTVANLLELELPFVEIYSRLMSEHTITEARALSAAIENIKTKNTLCYSHLSLDDLKRIDVSSRDLGEIIDYLFMIKDIELALFFYETDENQIRVSMRSKSRNVNELATSLGGGGHKLAAACTLNETLNDAIDIVLQKLEA